ncbi:TetR/AcrR family transcriptional regulator [Nocardia puris]|uniref:TetR/AcrR family transcriptional regulator n=1 Tax=Nocardia puris TaxID=208602 RepID=UPI0018942315|nr:TetR/AcrR family transcriptional regulator [Nocardia puris]MBF6216390.1 TetR/AcrR family transcriptional regulator [Nocardia puris]
MTTSTRPPSVQQRLLDTADAMFYAEGIRAVAIDRVIAESGVSKSTMYVHFRTKEDLVQAYLRRRTDNWRARVEAEVAHRATDPVEQALTVFDLFDEMFHTPGYRGCPFVNAAAEYPHHDGIRETIAYHRDWINGLFPKILGKRCDPELAASLVQLLDGAIAAAHLDGDLDSAQRARRTAERIL